MSHVLYVCLVCVMIVVYCGHACVVLINTFASLLVDITVDVRY